MGDYHNTTPQRTNDQDRVPLKSWKQPLLVRLGSVAELTGRIGSSKHRDSNFSKNRTG